MKILCRLCLILSFLIVSNYSLGQETINVGLTVANVTNDAWINLSSTGNAASSINFKNGGSSYWVFSGPRTNESNNPFALIYHDGTNSHRYITVLNNGNMGIGTATPSALFHLKTGAFLADGSGGTTPFSGSGTRMMWIPNKAAFRAGLVSGDHWDDANIGIQSAAFGYNNKVTAFYSFSAGARNTVTGHTSTVFGSRHTISGNYSFAVGDTNTISNHYSVAMGARNSIGGIYSTATGYQNAISGSYSFASGDSNRVSNHYSSAMGYQNVISNHSSFAAGGRNTVGGANSFALGYRSAANGTNSGALGTNIKASADYSFVIGTGASLNNPLENTTVNSLLIGYNSNLPTLFVRGAGGLGTTGAVAIATTTIPNSTSAPTSAGYKFVVAGHSYLNGSVVIGDQSGITGGQGSPTAAHMFPAGYKLYVTDGILTEKVKVALKSSSAWADFVFDKDYKLMPLDSVETFIKENKHLPFIPSADEAVKNGVDLLEMDAKLLQKVEELTLYMIEQKKEMELLKKQNAELNKKVEELLNK